MTNPFEFEHAERSAATNPFYNGGLKHSLSIATPGAISPPPEKWEKVAWASVSPMSSKKESEPTMSFTQKLASKLAAHQAKCNRIIEDYKLNDTFKESVDRLYA